MYRLNSLGSEKRVIRCVHLHLLARATNIFRANQYLVCADIVILSLIHVPALLRSLFARLYVCSWRDFVDVTRPCYMSDGVPRIILTLVTPLCWTRPWYIFRYVCRTWFSRCYTFLLHAPVWLLHVILSMFYVSFTRPGVCTALDSAAVTGPVSCRSWCAARGFVAFSLFCATWPFVSLRACLHGGGVLQIGEVTRLGGVTRLSI